MFTVLLTQREESKMRVLVVLSSLVMLSQAQRPSYASSGPIGRPGLASRFKDDNASSSTTISVENRVGEGGSTPKIPVDARGDQDLVNTLNTWDREHQPFWLLNAEHIERQRNTTRGTVVNRNQLNTQGVQGSQITSQMSQSNNQGTRGSGDSIQSSLSNRNGGSDVSNNSGNARHPSNNREWLFGRPSQGDIRPVHEYPEGSMSDQMIYPRQRQTGDSQKRLRFHYERNNFH